MGWWAQAQQEIYNRIVENVKSQGAELVQISGINRMPWRNLKRAMYKRMPAQAVNWSSAVKKIGPKLFLMFQTKFAFAQCNWKHIRILAMLPRSPNWSDYLNFHHSKRNQYEYAELVGKGEGFWCRTLPGLCLQTACSLYFVNQSCLKRFGLHACGK